MIHIPRDMAGSANDLWTWLRIYLRLVKMTMTHLLNQDGGLSQDNAIYMYHLAVAPPHLD